jgi:hypothetical protein
MPLDDQAALCCLLNSFVANYLVRLWVTTHLGAATVERLPVPRPPATSWTARRLRELGQQLLRAGGDHSAAYAEAQGLAAALYGVSAEEFELVLGTFPLVEDGIKARAAESHRRLASKCSRVYTLGGDRRIRHDS